VSEISREKAIELLWEQGELSWKLRGVQKDIREQVLNDVNAISVIVAGRRTGKSHTMLLIATEFCLKKKNAIVKIACPKQRMVKTIIRPIMRIICEDCPKHLMPEWREADKIYVFPSTNSEIHVAGTDNENVESLRGSYADLVILDEASYMSDLDYITRNVVSPMLKTRGGRMILASTPSRDSNHTFITDYMLPYQMEGRTKVYTVFDNPNFDEKIIKEIIDEYPLGVNDPSFRLEYLCEVMRDASNTILPSFTSDAEKEIVRDDYTRPVYFDPYVSFDIGGVDLSALLFGFYDYENARLVIEDEIVVDGTTNTEILAQMIHEKEKTLWENPLDKSQIPPFMRVIDTNNKILATDLLKLHGLLFSPVKKDKKQAAINSLDVAIARREIVIHPRCVHLIYHMKMAEWNKAQTDFKRLKDTPGGKIRGGHADCLAALIYLHRSVIKSHNPFPAGYNVPTGSNYFKSLTYKPQEQSGLADFMKKVFKKT
jgi:hypothetical protein